MPAPVRNRTRVDAKVRQNRNRRNRDDRRAKHVADEVAQRASALGLLRGRGRARVAEVLLEPRDDDLGRREQQIGERQDDQDSQAAVEHPVLERRQAQTARERLAEHLEHRRHQDDGQYDKEADGDHSAGGADRAGVRRRGAHGRAEERAADNGERELRADGREGEGDPQRGDGDVRVRDVAEEALPEGHTGSIASPRVAWRGRGPRVEENRPGWWRPDRSSSDFNPPSTAPTSIRRDLVAFESTIEG